MAGTWQKIIIILYLFIFSVYKYNIKRRRRADPPTATTTEKEEEPATEEE